jgi:phage terminase small subunit
MGTVGRGINKSRPLQDALASEEELVEEFDLTPREARFVTLYVCNPTNASAAARGAGFPVKSATVTASQMIRKESVAAAIAQEMMKLQERTRITQDRILHELAILAFSNIHDFVVTDDGELGLRPGVPEYVMRAVQSVKKKITRKTMEDGTEMEWVELEIKLWNKPEALKLAGQHFGMYKENINVTGQITHEHKQVWDFGGRQIMFG